MKTNEIKGALTFLNAMFVVAEDRRKLAQTAFADKPGTQKFREGYVDPLIDWSLQTNGAVTAEKIFHQRVKPKLQSMIDGGFGDDAARKTIGDDLALLLHHMETERAGARKVLSAGLDLEESATRARNDELGEEIRPLISAPMNFSGAYSDAIPLVRKLCAAFPASQQSIV